MGVTKAEMAAWNPWFPANFIAETTATELAVMGREVDLPAANKTYYRVVAVDEQGKRSGPSDYATAPRPVIYSKPVLAAKVGAEYRYQVCANRSLGDLSARMKGKEQVSGYFDIEKPRFALERGPAWLKIDEATGVLSGTPGRRRQGGSGRHRHDRPGSAEAGRKGARLGQRKGALHGDRAGRQRHPEVRHRGSAGQSLESPASGESRGCQESSPDYSSARGIGFQPVSQERQARCLSHFGCS